MQVSVYRTRQRGVRLPRPLAPIGGQLTLGPYTDATGRPALRARLESASREGHGLLPDLLGARVLRITRDGIVIMGYEIVPRRTNNKASGDAWKQGWWVLCHTLELADSLDLAALDDFFRVVPALGTGTG